MTPGRHSAPERAARITRLAARVAATPLRHGFWRRTLGAAALCLTALVAEAAIAPADVVLTRGAIYTANPAQPWVEAVAITRGRLAYVGSAKGAEAYVGSATRVIDLAGRYAMPGLVDAHVHPVMGGLKVLYECNFPFTATPAEVAGAVAACAARLPPGTWIKGGQWDSGFFDNHHLDSPRAFLDRVTERHPVMLIDDSEHNAWVNTAALRAAGITATTPDPPGGRIARGADGEPNGVLLESAFRVLFRKSVPPFTAEQQSAAVREATRLANGYGITALKDAGAYEDYLAAYDAVDAAGQLTVHVAACLRTSAGTRTEPLDYAALEARRDRYRTPHVHTEFVKIFLDGVPTSARTAAMIAPYTASDEHGPGFNGSLLVESPLLARDLVELDRRGFTVKMHAAGDRSVRVGLDAIEAARRANGMSGLHHELAHAGFIDPADIPRFAALDAIPDYSPEIWHPSPIIASIIAALGERGGRYWPTHALLASGARIAGGSDWPAAVEDENPWIGIEALVTRKDPRGRTPGTLWPEESVTLADAIRIYTVNGARALRLEHVTGSLEAGKSADLIVLDRNLFGVPIEEVGKTRVTMTFFEGRLVHEASR
jgi:predicted amidohydrolase YtcJ